MSDPLQPTKPLKPCPVCRGRGYFNCECWPGDCICGWGDEECEECSGTGDADYNGEWLDYHSYDD